MIKRILAGKKIFMEEDAESAQKEPVFSASSTRMPTPTDERKTLMDEHEHEHEPVQEQESIKRLEKMITEKMKEVEELKEKVKLQEKGKGRELEGNDLDGRIIEYDIF